MTVTVTDVVDGDTIEVRHEDGTTDTVRLLGVDTPEVHTDVSPAEFEDVPDTTDGQACLRNWGDQATAFVKTELAGETVTLQFDEGAERRGTFGRLLTYVILDDRNVNYELVAGGYARVFDSQFSLSDAFYAAETAAQTAQDGVWECRSASLPDGDGNLTVAAMQADAPGNDHENRNGEYVVFRNEGPEPIDLSGWRVEDEAGHTYQFPTGFALAPGDTVTLYTGAGSDTDTSLYWRREDAVWNNDGDTVFVSDETGSVVLEYSYG
jgi:micrococcal nuclease